MKARENPFSSDRVLQIRYRPQGWTWEGILSKLEAQAFRGLIVGPNGSGKTTLLEDLSKRMQRRGWRSCWLRLFANERRPSIAELVRFGLALRLNDLVVIDGAEQLGPLAWGLVNCLSHRASGLVATSHVPGRLPLLMECRTDSKLLGDLVKTLWPEVPDGIHSEIPRLQHEYNGNIREVLRALYDRQNMEANCPGIAGGSVPLPD